MVTPEQLKNWIETGFESHQLVYAALGDKMKAEVHALSMKTLTPSEGNSSG